MKIKKPGNNAVAFFKQKIVEYLIFSLLCSYYLLQEGEQNNINIQGFVVQFFELFLISAYTIMVFGFVFGYYFISGFLWYWCVRFKSIMFLCVSQMLLLIIYIIGVVEIIFKGITLKLGLFSVFAILLSTLSTIIVTSDRTIGKNNEEHV